MRIPVGLAAWLGLCVLLLGLEAGAVERRQLSGDIHEYSFPVRVGPGAHDVIVVHRVVRETAPWVPVRTEKAVFLVHGDVWGFRGAFLGSVDSQAVPHEQAFALFLARQDVDVWGIDLRWVNVPAGTTDFSFMKDWNLELHARDVGVGLSLARSMRASTLGGAGRLVLLGWSRGAAVGYAYLNREARLPELLRQVRGFIPVDMAYKLAPEHEAQRQGACQRYEALLRRQAAGEYEGGAVGLGLQGFGLWALTEPEAPSPVFPELTNRQFALTAGAATHLLMQPPFVSTYHFTGGGFGADGLPTGLTWTREAFLFEFLLRASPFQSLGEQLDTEALWCGAPDVPYDDHLGEVTVPVLYVSAAGGFGRFGDHGVSLLGSQDVSFLRVERLPEAGRVLDYGHADLFLADDAEATVWRPVLEWVRGH